MDSKVEKRFLFSTERKFFDVSAGNNTCKIDLRYGVPHISCNLLSYGGKFLPLNLSLKFVFPKQLPLLKLDTGLPMGIRTNYHQTCMPAGNVFYYTDGDCFIHEFEQSATAPIWFDKQGTGLLLHPENDRVIIYDESGNSMVFDSYGRLTLVHQKTRRRITTLQINYFDTSGRIESITDGMGRNTFFTYKNQITISTDSINRIIIEPKGDEVNVTRESDIGAVSDLFIFEGSNGVHGIRTAYNERISIKYDGQSDEIPSCAIATHENSMNFRFLGSRTIIHQDSLTQVIQFDEEDAVACTYQELKDEAVNLYCTTKNSDARVASLIPKDPTIVFGDQSSYTVGGNGTVLLRGHLNSSKENLPVGKFAVFMMRVSVIQSNPESSFSVELIDGEMIAAKLHFQLGAQGDQVVAIPFIVTETAPDGLQARVHYAQGEFTFWGAQATPLLGTAQRFCMNVNFNNGRYCYSQNPTEYVFYPGEILDVIINGISFRNVTLYPEDYIANARNAFGEGHSFNFWYNNKKGCFAHIENAQIIYSNAAITFEAGSVSYLGRPVQFYSLVSDSSGVMKLINPNYDKSTFTEHDQEFHLEVNTILSDMQRRAQRNIAYYDKDFYLLLELEGSDLFNTIKATTYTLDDAGDIIRIYEGDPQGLSPSVETSYAYDNGYLQMESCYVQGKLSSSTFTYDFFGNVNESVSPSNLRTYYHYDNFGVHLLRLEVNEISATYEMEYKDALLRAMHDLHGTRYEFSYLYGDVTNVQMQSTRYLSIQYKYGDIDLTILEYGNGYSQLNATDCYGRTVYIQSHTEYLAQYIYADDPQEGLSATSWDEVKNPSETSDLYKILDDAASSERLFQYNLYHMPIACRLEFLDEDTSIAECYLTYNEKLLVVSETYKWSKKTTDYPVEKIAAIRYTYSRDLNHYQEVCETVNSIDNRTVLTIQKARDILGRITQTIQTNDEHHGMLTDISYDNLSNLVDKCTYTKKSGTSTSLRTDSFTYDISGNIVKYEVNGDITRASGSSNHKAEILYEYDSANRLTVERNEFLGKTYQFRYDPNGNILSKTIYSYTESGFGTLEKEYFAQYSSPNQMSVWGDEKFEYDGCGNPTLYKNKKMTWIRGRLLGGYLNCTFKYDAEGERSQKTTNLGDTYYYVINGKLMREHGPDKDIVYLYDDAGIAGCIIDGMQFYYVRNGFGDVIALYETTENEPIAKYVYDAWGNCKVMHADGTESSDPSFVGNLNPIRYRGYYWDSDIGLYYLHTRWYDPDIGRFINLDQIQYLDPETIGGLNLYAYCLNNPIMGVDPDGTFWLTGLIVGLLIGAALGFAATVVADYVDDGEVFNGSIDPGTYIGATLVGAAVGGLTGGFGGEVLSFTVPTGFGWVTTGSSVAFAVTSTATVSISGTQIIGATVAAGLGIMFMSKPDSGRIRFNDGTGIDPSTGKEFTDADEARKFYQSIKDPATKRKWKTWLKAKRWAKSHLKGLYIILFGGWALNDSLEVQ